MHRSIPDTLRTHRLLLRPWRPTDAATLLPILEANVPHLAPWIPEHVSRPVPETELAQRLAGFAEDFASARGFRYAVFSSDGTQLLGEADLLPRVATGRVPLADADRVELGYWLASSHTGKGYATEAAGALLEVAERLRGMTCAEIRCDASNVASAAVPQRLGFQLAAVESGDQIWRKALNGNADARLHPRIDEVLAFLDEKRAALARTVNAIPTSLRERKPSSERWSVAQVLAHLAAVEGQITQLLQYRIDSARAKGIGAERDASPVVPTIDLARVLDRSRTIIASPATLPPDDVGADSAWATLESQRIALKAVVAAANGLALGEIVVRNPVLGPLDAYQWVVFVGAHEARHTLQIQEILAALG